MLAAVVMILIALAAWWRVESAPEEPEGVLTFEHQWPRHVSGTVDYAQTPPAGGDHAAKWLACGAYEQPVPDELAVHSLEHGTVWITYDPALPLEQLHRLEDALPDEGILSPYSGMEAPIVLTVWDRQLRLDNASDPRIEEFVAALANRTAPEPFNSCGGGVTSW